MRGDRSDSGKKNRCFLTFRVGGLTDFNGVPSLLEGKHTDDPKNFAHETMPQVIRHFLDNLISKGATDKELSPFQLPPDRGVNLVIEPEFLGSRQTGHTGEIAISTPQCSREEYEQKKSAAPEYYIYVYRTLIRGRKDELAAAGQRIVCLTLDISKEALASKLLNKSLTLDDLKTHTLEVNANYRNKSKGPYHDDSYDYDKDQVFAVSSDEDKQPLKKLLDTYINRVEQDVGTHSGDFGYDFWFFKESRAINRQANYLLAKQLREDLGKPNASIEQVFFDLENKRGLILYDQSKIKVDDPERYTKWGIHSDALNSIIATARDVVAQETTMRREHRRGFRV